MRNLQDAIDFCLEKEEQSAAFYLQVSRVVTSAGSRKVFEELADMENSHLKMLQDLDVAKLPEHIHQATPDLKISDYQHEVSFTPDMDLQSILTMAMKAEEKSHKIYLDMAEQYRDSADLHKLFDFMADQEARHKLALETQYDDLVLRED